MKYSLSAKNLVNRNLEAHASYCAGLMNVDATKEITGVLRTDSGLLSHSFNQAVTTAVMPSRILQRFVVDYFRERHSPFTLWHCANRPLDAGEMSELGFKRQPSMVAMAAEVVRLAADEELPENLQGKLELAPVTTESLEEYGQLQALAYSGEREGPQIRKFYQALAQVPEPKRSRLRYFAGRMDGKMVAGASLYASADALGFYDLFVDEQYRGQGIGRALFHYLVEQLQSSHHKHAVALTPADRQELLLEAGFFAVGEVACYRFEP
ncbi:GNAT family N-acetyltransferase [Microbulbifer flavimaris]|uniref:GNAT family N-acetyltransferase n=1 Tax=Microbulbifer flavimaris TaxID=1781068 RepID=A0ABX4HXZ9_9GAMM|nr:MULTISPECIES: GNAT family N-acetyltransferase [Microbulbifer]KUJ82832.1 acetyltransferase [Microbulbifer sp. ZGT114]PCO05009.1 GNAT family N-acetyltransferase [Microbulbifer flavimaris]